MNESSVYTDPRDWDRDERRDYLETIGLPLIADVGEPDDEISKYRGIEITWTSTLDARIVLVIDQMTEAERANLYRAYAHKGGCYFVWTHSPIPPAYREGQGVEVLGVDGEPIDYWVVGESWSLMRDQQAAGLGGLTYEEYLNSGDWKQLRERALTHYGRSCVLCGSYYALEVHHRTYVRVGAEELTDLIVLCDDCHGRYHGK